MITAPLVVLGQILGIAFAAGLNLYATVAVFGLAIRLGWIGGMPPAISGLSNPIVLITAAFLYTLEFFVDKIPYADTAWDVVHTIIRPVAISVLVFAALGEASLPIQVGGALLAALVALAAHGVKAGLRLILNARPRKAVNAAVSLVEDICAAGLAVAAFMYPIAALAIVAVATPLLALGGPRLWRAGVLAVRALLARLRGFFGRKGWREPADMPRRLRNLLPQPAPGRGQPRVMRAALRGMKGVGAYKNGWLVLGDEPPVFLFLSLMRPRRVVLPSVQNAEVRKGIWTDALEISESSRSTTVFLFKDGPTAQIALDELRRSSF